jgi:hypothetical protein
MNNQATASDVSAPVLTQHALLVAWGLYAQQIGLIEQLRQVKLKQKHHEHQPQSKVLEFLFARDQPECPPPGSRQHSGGSLGTTALGGLQRR